MNEQNFNTNELVSTSIFDDNLKLSEDFVKDMKKNGKKGLLLFVYAEWCGACMRFKPTFIEFMRNHSRLSVKALPYHNEDISNELNKMIEKLKSPPFKIGWFPTVISFDENGNFFSYYGNNENGKYRTKEDLEEYCNEVGDYSLNFSIIKI